MKYFVQRDELTVVAAAVHLGCAIKWIEDRRENLIAAIHARADIATVEVALDADGLLLGARLDHLEDCGAYPVGGTGGTGPFAAMLFPGPVPPPAHGVHEHLRLDEHVRPWRVPRSVDVRVGGPRGDPRHGGPRRRHRSRSSSGGATS